MLINKIREKQTILPLLGLGDKDTSSQSSSSNNSRSNSPVVVNNETPVQPETKAMVAEPTVPVVSTAEYYNPEDVGSDSDQDNDDGLKKGPGEVQGSEVCVPGDGSAVKGSEVLIPADPELKKIIDKLVVYVDKNGRDFEIVVKRKCDPRFSFLEPGDAHNPYYEQELAKLLPNTNNVPESEDKAQKQSGGVLRFSIKKPAKAPTVLDRPALEQEDQEEESDSPPTPPPPPIISTPTPLVEDSVQHTEETPGLDSITSNGNTSLSVLNNNSISESVTTPVAPAPPVISVEYNADEDKKKVERKRRAEMFLRRLQQINTGPPAPPHVINVPDSSDDQAEPPPPPDLKAKLKALRTRSQSPSTLVKAPPPPRIRRKHHHKSSSSYHKRKSRSHSRSSSRRDSSSGSEDKTNHKRKKHSSRHKHRDLSLTPSPKRRKKDSKSVKKHAKKKSSRNRSSSPESKKSKKSSHHHHKRKKSSETNSKSHSSVAKSGKKKIRAKSRLRSEPSSESSESD
uniref:SURP motif domain-containing protein n=1 Tax=Cacopsylla melanoneura TaxID=428564 RepID=A0A8D8RIM6_9HEMI